MKKLAIITTHPIQYYAPVFKRLQERKKIEVKVFYTAGGKKARDRGFGKDITWDIPLTEGYPYVYVENTASEPGSHHFKGISNPGILDLIREFAPDAILVYGWSYASHLQVMRHFKGLLPVTFRGDSTLIDASPWWKKLARNLFLRWVYRNVDLAFYTGKANRSYFLAHGLNEKQLVFAPHAIDNTRFQADRSGEAVALRQELKIPADALVILFVGKFEEKKSPLQLIDAFLSLNRADTHLLFAGDGILLDQMKSRAGSDARIHISSFVNQHDIPVYYQASNLFCLPSAGPGESWGLAVNEAMAAGKAVLVSDRCGCAADLVKNGENGLIFSYGKRDGLRMALDELLADKFTLENMGRRSLERIKKYSFEEQVTAMETAIVGTTRGRIRS